MSLRNLSAPLMPAVLAGAAATAAHYIWHEGLATVLAAMAGALIGAVSRPSVNGTGRRAPAQPGRRAAEAAPQTDAAHLPVGSGRLLLERLPLAVMAVDGSDRVRFANTAACELFPGAGDPGYHAASLRAPKLLAALEACRAGAGPQTVSFDLMRRSELHLRAHLDLLPDQEAGSVGPPRPGTVVAVIEDVTQSKRSETLFRDFVANASHELKTPLASISGIIETLQGHARNDPAAAERFLEIMGLQAERMRRLVESMLSLNRIEQNERTPPRHRQRLRDIVGETIDAMAPLARSAGISLGVTLPEEGVEVLGSREELAQVFQNLVDNAIKYGREGDSVTVTALAPGVRSGMIGIAVEDTGPGIARTHLPRLTERFYRVSTARSRASGGTGLGLAIVKHVLTRHRGQLEIVSEEGRGSRFTVWLPLAKPAAAPARIAIDQSE